MPPRKRTKLSSPAASSTPQESTKPPTPTPNTTDSAQRSDAENELINDPWTDEQETALLKSIVRWKPVGMHKHFRMLAIAEYMKSQGYAPADEEHTRIPGIWKKLGSLYNLPALDEREDSVISQDPDESEESEYCPFELPEEEYGELMFAKRLAERSESPETSMPLDSRRGSTVADTDEPRSSPAPSRGRRGKATRASTRGTRSTRLQVEVERPSSSSVETEDEQMEDADENEGDAEDEGDSGAEEGDDDNDVGEADAETASSPATRSTRIQTAKSKKDRKSAASVNTATRRTGRRR